MRIRHDGKTGIGTASPSEKLEIASNASVNMKLNNTGQNITLEIGAQSSAARITAGSGDRLGLGAGNTQDFLNIASGGNIGIYDTAPQDYLEINGSGKGLGGLTISNSTHNHAALSFARSSTATSRIYLTEPEATHTGQLNFQTSNASGGSPNLVTAMVIDENQRVGIQITSPEGQLHINTESAEATKVYIDGEVNQQKSLEIRHYDASEGSGAGRNLFYFKTPASNRLDIGGFTNGSSEYQIMTLLESGEVIVGGTTAGQSSAATIYPTGNITSGSLTATGSGEFSFNKTETYNPVITANDSESDTGQIIALQLGGTTKGVIGIGSANGSDTYIASGTTSSAGFGLRFIDYTVTNAALPCRGDGSTVDDTMDLGNSGARFDDIYATNGTINTSDRNDKQDIQALTDAEQRVATACKGLIRRFKWQSAVTQKGDDARYHFGIMAQDLQDAFTAEGLDAGDYGMFISSTWTDDEGNEQTRLGVRYNELLAFIIATL